MAMITRGTLNHVRPKVYIATHYPIYHFWSAFGNDTVSHPARGGLAATGNLQRPSIEQIGEPLETIGELSVVPYEWLIGTRRKRHGRSVVNIAQTGKKSAMNGEPRGEVGVVRDEICFKSEFNHFHMLFSVINLACAVEASETINEGS
jgi:hypothetical protein